jgi:hypothetical protein
MLHATPGCMVRWPGKEMARFAVFPPWRKNKAGKPIQRAGRDNTPPSHSGRRCPGPAPYGPAAGGRGGGSGLPLLYDCEGRGPALHYDDFKMMGVRQHLVTSSGDRLNNSGDRACADLPDTRVCQVYPGP